MTSDDERVIDWYGQHDHIASFYPYWIDNDSRKSFHSFENAIQHIPLEKRVIDVAGMLEFTNKNYMLENRTLIQGLQRAQWLAKPDGHGGWTHAEVPQHGHATMAVDTLSSQFTSLVKAEVLGYLEKANTVGLLLSGGMDSRIVAGLLRNLQRSGDFKGNVVALTWGMPDSRDVVYAQQIARRFDWDIIHFPLGPEILRENIQICAAMGAEFSPIHLHAMPQVRNLNGLDVVLAGSYGDSIGRSEYSGARVEQLAPILPQRLNKLGLFNHALEKRYAHAVEEDAYGYRRQVNRQLEYQYREIEQQRHYLRRMLQACMNHIAERIPLYQAFTSPKVVGLLWGLSPDCRGDALYASLLPTLLGELRDIPWARTGRPFGHEAGEPDSYLIRHHRYGQWLRQDLKNYITDTIENGPLFGLNVFNEKSVRTLLKIWPNSNTYAVDRLDEVFSWMASLSLTVARYSISGHEASPTWFADRAMSVAGPAYGYYRYRRQRQKKG